ASRVEARHRRRSLTSSSLFESALSVFALPPSLSSTSSCFPRCVTSLFILSSSVSWNLPSPLTSLLILFVLQSYNTGKNVHTLCLEVTEPDADDEITGERDAYMASVLSKYKKSLTERTKHHLGYPYNLNFDYGALSQLQHFSINNLGDPFIESNYGVHSRQFE
ncbi:hypothetical protein S245_030350, partial [Arachis hypogaea]